MPNRLLKESICSSKSINRLTPEQEVFFYRLIVNCDDHGYFDADPVILRARLYPRRADTISLDAICEWLLGLVREQMAVVFECNGSFYVTVPSWRDHQHVRNQNSKYPELGDGCRILPTHEINCEHLLADDSNCEQLQASASKCPRTRTRTRTRNTDSDSVDLVGFDQFWAAYPKKRSKGRAEDAFSEAHPDEQLLATMLAKIEQAKKSGLWTKDNGRFIPHPATWLRDRGWEDETDPAPESAPKDDKWRMRG